MDVRQWMVVAVLAAGLAVAEGPGAAQVGTGDATAQLCGMAGDVAGVTGFAVPATCTWHPSAFCSAAGEVAGPTGFPLPPGCIRSL